VNLVEILAVGAHPDDVELGCGGLLLAMRDRGYRFAIVDLTAGEKGSRGTREERAKEAKAAAELLGATARECLDLPDTAVEVTDGAVRRIVETLRKWRPQLVVSMHAGDLHPDHAACARLVERATFLAPVTKYACEGAPHRVSRVIRYSRHPWFVPSFVVDITDHVERKVEAILCYASQFTRDAEGPKTSISAPTFLDDLRAFWRHHGTGTGALYAEPFAMDGVPALPDPVAALCAERRELS
jgi:bacillithiol biosynthesis deacetylase BshB1